ncbi:MAG TPA: BMC domain-containing protein [Polyangia bacterium]|nr:BMC domain-containing protein [Polyangia bacterium]
MQGPFIRRDGEGARVRGPALGLVESNSIARGFVIADAMVKKAPVELVLQRTVSPGKHLTLVSGEVADVEEAMRAGVDVAAHTLVDRLELPQPSVELLAALRREGIEPKSAVGIVETFSVASTLLAADAATKAAQVTLAELRLADGLGGKAYFVIGGEQADVEAGLYAAEIAIPAGLLLARELIARPHDDLLAHLRK